jgi:hypothetical protein
MLVRQFNAESAIESKVKAVAAPVRKHRREREGCILSAGSLSRPWALLLPSLLLALFYCTSLPGQSSLTLAWDDDGDPEVAGFLVYYGPASQDYTQIVPTGLQFSYTITGLVGGVTNYFEIAALDADGNELSYSDEISYIAPIVVGAPVLVQATILPDDYVLTWPENLAPGVVGYTVYYGTSSGNYSSSVQTSPGFACTLSGLAPGTTYFFAVAPCDTNGPIAAPADEVSYTTAGFVPTSGPVAQVTAVLMPEGDLLFWDESPPTNGGGYSVYYGTSSYQYTNSVQTDGSFVCTITGLVQGVTYYFAVGAYGSAGYMVGEFSDEQRYKVPVLPLTINIAVLSDGQDAFEITGPAGKTYEVLGSPDQLQWTVLGTGTIGPSGTLQILEPPSTLDMYPNYVLSEVDTSIVRPSLKLSLTPGGNMVLSASGQVAHAYAVLATGNLAMPAWTSLGTIYPDSTGNMTFTDTASNSQPARFYRLQDVGYAPPPLRLQIAQSPDGSMVVSGTGQAGSTFNIFVTEDLVSWSLLGSSTSDATGAFEFTDYIAYAFSSRFYRAAQIPN